jgi:hypothetical protein
MTVYETPKDSTLRFLRFLRDGLDLTYLSIDSLCEQDLGGSEPLITLPASEEELVCDGREEVEEGLKRLIEEVKQEYQDDLSWDEDVTGI